MCEFDFTKSFFIGKNAVGSKYNVNDKVLFKNNVHTILGVNCFDSKEYEYIIDNYCYLVYEFELIPLQVIV